MRHLKHIGVILLLVLVPVLSLALPYTDQAKLTTEGKRGWIETEVLRNMTVCDLSTFQFAHINKWVAVNKLYIFAESYKMVNAKTGEVMTVPYYITPLMATYISYKLELRSYILDQKPDLNIKDTEGKTALMYECSYDGQFDNVEKYLNLGADITAKDNSGRNIFFYLRGPSIYSNDSIIFLALNKGVDLNHADDAGLTPLMNAVKQKQLFLVMKYLDAGAKVNFQDNLGKTALHYSVNTDTTGFLTRALLAWDANPTVQDKAGNTSLNSAAESGNLESVKLLFAKKPEMLNVKNKTGWTPLETAIRKCHPQIALFLKEQGAK